MKAKFNGSHHSAINYSHQKELVNQMQLVAYQSGKFDTVVDARFYMGRSSQSSTVYCFVWIHGKGFYTSGRGSAGGYGYYKESAALAYALDSAGVTLYGSPGGVRRWAYDTNRELTAVEHAAATRADLRKQSDIGGVGETAMREALEAIARALGYRKFTIV